MSRNEVLDKAEKLAQEWLSATSFTGDYDMGACLKALSGRKTKEGGPVISFVVKSFEDAPTALLFGSLIIKTIGAEDPSSESQSQLRDQLWTRLGGQL